MDSYFLSQAIEEWVSDFGDTTFWGWVITVTYGLCAIASYYYIQCLKRVGSRHRLMLWRCIFVLVLLLGINKQLDFQTLIATGGRAVSSSQGWYEHRRWVRTCFAKTMIVSLFACCSVILFKTRRILRKSVLELLGAGVLIAFTLIRTGSLTQLHKAEQLRFSEIPHIHALELLGLLLILSAIGLGLKKQGQHRDRI